MAVSKINYFVLCDINKNNKILIMFQLNKRKILNQIEKPKPRRFVLGSNVSRKYFLSLSMLIKCSDMLGDDRRVKIQKLCH